MTVQRIFLTALILGLIGCTSEKRGASSTSQANEAHSTFREEASFLRQHTSLLILKEPSGQGMIALAPALQGRVMTSTAAGPNGRSHGWVNRALFESGDTLEQINAFGGEVGAGAVSLGGRGELRDWEIMNVPAKGYSTVTEWRKFLAGVREGRGRQYAIIT